jgi:hypothetical protein
MVVGYSFLHNLFKFDLHPFLSSLDWVDIFNDDEQSWSGAPVPESFAFSSSTRTNNKCFWAGTEVSVVFLLSLFLQLSPFQVVMRAQT